MADESCERCPHPWADHELQGKGMPPTTGFVVCPVEGCECRGTWSTKWMVGGRWADLGRQVVADEHISAVDHPKVSFIFGVLMGVMGRFEEEQGIDLQWEWDLIDHFTNRGLSNN